MAIKSINLEHFYAKLNKPLALVESYSECIGLEFIIKACRLKPLEYLEDRSPNINLYRKWIDEFGNSLNILKKRRLKITCNDLSIDKNNLGCTDLYYGLSLDKVASISKLVYICAGTEEDNYQPCYFLTFLGIDNYLRSYMYLYDEWQQVSPLCLGMDNLKLIANKKDIKYYLSFNKINNMPIPCIKAQQWLTILPAKSWFFNIINKDHAMIAEILTKGNMIDGQQT
jgi:hypothetical protein